MVEYSCPKCSKMFKQKGHLTNHLKRKRPCNPDNLNSINMYFDYFMPNKTMFGSVSDTKSSIGSLKKFYKYLVELNRLSKNDYDEILEMIKNNKDERLTRLLYFYLCSKFAQSIFLWSQEGTNHPRFPNYVLEKLPFGKVSEDLLEYVNECYEDYITKLEQSKELYKEAEKILLNELGLLNHKPNHKLTFTASIKEIKEAKRFDAEYFQPKYKEIIEKIENYKNGWDYVKNIITYKKGVEVGSEAYQNEGIPFVRVSDFSIYGIDKVEKKISKELYEELKDQYAPREGEILFTKDGTIGISYVLKEDFEGILSGAFLRLNLKSKYKDFEKECLALIFNSIICKMQVEKLSGGALIAHLKPSDFEKFKIPLIDQKTQKIISQKIQESHKLRKESKELLKLAIKKVEEEIEKEANK